MSPRRMTQEDAQRIAKSRGSNDGFARRASMTVRNEDDRRAEGQQGSSGSQNTGGQQGSSGGQNAGGQQGSSGS
ncbi:hypothetical protein GGR51DRAFT_537130 [Nemania sp. FL0031]|nr:hypothetical protein GGR51DRAFT_537130 [Nemania sp. FL0031]